VTINATTARQWRPLFQLEGFDRTLAKMERPANINPAPLPGCGLKHLRSHLREGLLPSRSR
jgi:hypothetical protein